MKARKRFDMETLATLATSATRSPSDNGESNGDELELNPCQENAQLAVVNSAEDRYVAIAMDCLKRLQKKCESNLERGGYAPSDASVPIANWITECARSGLSSTRLRSIQHQLLRSVIFDSYYLRELSGREKQEWISCHEIENQRARVDSKLEIVDQKIASAIDGMPTTLDDIRQSKLFVEGDLDMIASGEVGSEGLRLYIGSWLLADGQFPFVLHADWENRLQGRDQI